MKTFKAHYYYRNLTTLILISLTLYSCAPIGGGSSSTRKKMPEFTTSDGLEGSMPFGSLNKASASCGFAFSPINVNMLLDGNMQQFVSVALPNPTNDALAISLINGFKPLALPLLSAWARQERHGVVLDLTNHDGSETSRTDYLLEKNGDFAIPLVIIWDEASASRISKLKDIISDIQSIKLSCTEGKDPVR